MKIRQGFISNSSTTSFCIYGVHFSRGELFKVMNAIDVKAKLMLANMNKSNDMEEMDDNDLFQVIDEAYDFKNVDCYSPEDGGVYVGRSWSSIKDDETGKQFKDSVKNELKQVITIPDNRYSSYEETIEG